MAVTGVGVAETVDAAGIGGEVLSVGGRSSEGENRNGNEKGRKGESVEFHGRSCGGCLKRRGRVCCLPMTTPSPE